MRKVDVLLSVLTLVAVGMGFAAYKAWNPDSEPREPVSGTPTAGSPPLVAVAREPAQGHGQLAQRPTIVREVECRNGLLYWHADVGTKPVASRARPGDAARCEIQVEPVRPESSQASD